MAFNCICMPMTLIFTIPAVPSSTDQLQIRLSNCIDVVACWMQSNRLQLNTQKTEVLWCTSDRRQHLLTSDPTRIGSDCITLSSSVRDLSIYLDSDVSMWTHAIRTTSRCFGVLHQLWTIKTICTSWYLSRTRGVNGPVSTWLWKRHFSRHTSLPTQSAAGCNKRRSLSDV